jgi:4-hydroxy-3-methylbut-2-en-1-yl diphosphate synthase IspG/GcpE
MIYMQANFADFGHYVQTISIPPQPICGLKVGRELLREVGYITRLCPGCSRAASDVRATPRPGLTGAKKTATLKR